MFVLGDDGALIEMKETPYDSEALLQQLLGDYPNLLAGDQIDSDQPRRWLLAAAQRAKAAGASSSRKWDEASFFDDLHGKKPDAVPVASRILHWAKAKASRIAWGTGAQSGSFVPVLHHKGTDHYLFAVYTYGNFETFFQYYLKRPPFTSEALRVEKLDRLNAVPGVSLPQDGIVRRPSFPLKALIEEGRTEALLGVYDWVLQQIRAV
jgi:hypothetical protein